MLGKFIQKADYYGKNKIPFLFIIDFELKHPLLFTLPETRKQNLFYKVNNHSNYNSEVPIKSSIQIPEIAIEPINFLDYSKAFNFVMDNILAGNTYLLNLTFPTKININAALLDIFLQAAAPYKLYFKDSFIIFSPESFIRTQDNKIFSFPMKGTINAEVPDAEKTLLSNNKEKWEHNTIVDLIRNDLAMVSGNILVEKYRYITKIKTNKNTLLQASSIISGTLPQDWQKNIGTILTKLLPAGSVSGAPKSKTLNIIKEAEKIDRNYYTGIFGIFDGNNLDSAVNIRFIEKTENSYFYRSGGGITHKSKAEEEYKELLDKIYVPSF